MKLNQLLEAEKMTPQEIIAWIMKVWLKNQKGFGVDGDQTRRRIWKDGAIYVDVSTPVKGQPFEVEIRSKMPPLETTPPFKIDYCSGNLVVKHVKDLSWLPTEIEGDLRLVDCPELHTLRGISKAVKVASCIVFEKCPNLKNGLLELANISYEHNADAETFVFVVEQETPLCEAVTLVNDDLYYQRENGIKLSLIAKLKQQMIDEGFGSFV